MHPLSPLLLETVEAAVTETGTGAGAGALVVVVVLVVVVAGGGVEVGVQEAAGLTCPNTAKQSPALATTRSSPCTTTTRAQLPTRATSVQGNHIREHHMTTRRHVTTQYRELES